MIDCHPFRLSRLLALLAVSLPASLAMNTVSADERSFLPALAAPAFDDASRLEELPEPSGDRLPVSPEGSASSNALGTTTLPPLSSMPSAFRSDFWMVSSYRCRQFCSKSCVCGQLDYLYADGCQMHPSEQRTFHQSLEPGAPVCIVVHGSFVEADMLSEILTGGGIKNAETLVEENLPMFQWIRGAAPDRPLNVVFYAWPSDAPITYVPQADVALLGRRSSFNALYLADLIDSISPDHPICLVGHSHGARMVTAALHLLAGGEVQGHRLCHPPANCNRIRTVLIAGALDHHWLVPGQRYGRALYRTEALVNVKNDHDVALNLYPLRRLFSHRAIGESGVTNRDRWALGELNCRLAELDVTPLIGRGHLWKHYTNRPEIACSLRPYLYFEDATATTAARKIDAPIRQTGGAHRASSSRASYLRGMHPLRGSSEATDQISNRRS